MFYLFLQKVLNLSDAEISFCPGFFTGFGRVYQNLLISYRIIRLLPLYLYVLYGFRRTRRARVLEKEAKSVPRMHIILSPDAWIGVDGKRYAANIN